MVIAEAPLDGTGWAAYALAHPAATFFHQPGWLEVVRRTFGYRHASLLARRDGRVVGFLFARRLLGFFVALPFPLALELPPEFGWQHFPQRVVLIFKVKPALLLRNFDNHHRGRNLVGDLNKRLVKLAREIERRADGFARLCRRSADGKGGETRRKFHGPK